MQSQISTLISEVSSALRFRWYGLIAAAGLALVGWFWVSSMPDVYEAHARVYVNPTSVLQELLGDQIAVAEVDSQIDFVRQAMLGREQLETVLSEIGYDLNEMTIEQREVTITRLRNAILIEPVQLSNTSRFNREPDSTFSINYSNSDRDTAVIAVSTLLDTFVNYTLGESLRTGEAAGQFLDERVEEYEIRLAESEAALADFKRINADVLPNSEDDYFQRIRSSNEALMLSNRDMRLLTSKRDQLQSQLRNESSVVSGGDDGVDAPANSLDARIRDYESQLDLALLQYTERHPDVIALRETLEFLKAERAERLLALGIDDADVELFSLNASPVYQAMQIELNETEVEIATLNADISQQAEQLLELEALMEEMPQIEAQLAQLNRDYDVVYEQYLQLVRSRETQDLTRKASEADQEDFRIIDLPFASSTPSGPPRMAMHFVVMLGSIFAGFALCYVCAQIWSVFGSARALRDAVELPVLGTVGHAWLKQQREEYVSARNSFAVALSAFLIVFSVLVFVDISAASLFSNSGS